MANNKKTKSFRPRGNWIADYCSSPGDPLRNGWHLKEAFYPHTPIALFPEPIGGVKIDGRSPYQTNNAALAAAAPKLLRTLKKLTKAYGMAAMLSDRELVSLHKLIAVAEGRAT